MSITAKAVITDGKGKFFLDQIELGDPQKGEVLVEIKASGVCHTDFDSLTWNRVSVMGHEGAGVVLACGPEVSNVKPGDRVLLNWAIPCGACFQCRRGAENICEKKPSVPNQRFRHNDSFISTSFDLGTMATHTVVPWQAAVKIDVEIPFPSAAILGCGVMTGFGSAVNAAKVDRGSSVVVLGTGGVGLSVIQGAVYAGASKIIAIDLNPNRLALAKQFGATDVLLAEKEDAGLLRAAAQVRKLTERGADYAFECTAVPELAASPLAMVRNGGMAVGVSGIEQVVGIDMELFEWDKRYINPLYGQCRPFVDFPILLSLYKRGELKLDEMVTRTYPLSELAQAFEHMRQGLNAKGVLIPDASA
ncbi:MAG TPA: alcohol dehydrogenase catalytic domain-containing protein [Acidobacteriaceae bacterium]|nr:alcohol dehydrogenase catalytic domain-containing protein [Acidobacteriaceae bacterium]